MMKQIKSLLRSVFPSPSIPFDPALRQFLSVDRRAIEEELDLKGRAERDGRNNIPRADSTRKDAIAADIDSYLMKVIRRGKDELQDHWRAIGALDAVQSVDMRVTKLKTSTLETLNALYTDCKNGVNRIYSLKGVVADGELDYARFKSENNLTRPVSPPKDRNAAYALIVFALVLEAVFNAVALGSAHPEGVVGVFTETLVIAMVNVFLGFFLGFYFWRQTNYLKRNRALFGYATTVSLVGFIVIFNFIIGHYRDSLSGLQAQQATTDLSGYIRAYGELFSTTMESAFSEDFWKFGGLMSPLLMLVGIGMATFAAIKGFDLDDPYPGYGRLSRDQDKRNFSYAALSSKLHTELRDVGRKGSGSVSDIFESGQSSRGAVQDHKETIDAQTLKYLSWVSELKSVGMALYATYRQINEQHRTTPSPPVFEIDFAIPDGMVDLPARPNSVEEPDVEYLRNLKEECLTIINTATNRYLGIYKTIGELAPENVRAKRAGTYDVEVEKINSDIQDLARAKGIVTTQEHTDE